jgi:hypothetical protein
MTIPRTILLLSALVCGCFHEQAVSSDESGSESTSGDPVSTSASGTTAVDGSSSGTSAGSADGTSSDTSGDPSGQSSESTSADESSSSGEEPISDWALYFGGDGILASEDDVDLDLPDDFTVEAWVRIDSIDAHGTIVQHRGAGTTGWRVWITSGPSRIYFGFYDNNGVWGEVWGPPLMYVGNGWHHVAAVKNGLMISLFINGEVVGAQAGSTAISAPVVPLLVGTDGAADPLSSIALDDVRISDGARYTAAFDPEPVLDADIATKVLLLLDEGVGSVCTDTGIIGAAFSTDGTAWTEGNTEV